MKVDYTHTREIYSDILLFSHLNMADHLSTADSRFLSQHNIQLGLELFNELNIV